MGKNLGRWKWRSLPRAPQLLCWTAPLKSCLSGWKGCGVLSLLRWRRRRTRIWRPLIQPWTPIFLRGRPHQTRTTRQRECPLPLRECPMGWWGLGLAGQGGRGPGLPVPHKGKCQASGGGDPPALLPGRPRPGEPVQLNLKKSLPSGPKSLLKQPPSLSGSCVILSTPDISKLAFHALCRHHVHIKKGKKKQ